MKKCLLLTAVSASMFFISCDDEETKPEDKTAPEISFTSELDAEFYQDVISIEATASDNIAATSMEISVDDVVISTVNGSTIQVNLDTEDYEDGSHVIKVVAKDEEGNEGVVEKTINVMNYFMTLDLVVNNPEPDVDYWYYVLDEEGDLVDIQKVASDAEEVRFSTPANHTSESVYSLVTFEHTSPRDNFAAQNNFGIVGGYTQGTYNETIGFETSSGTNLGEHTFNISGVETSVTTVWHSGNNSYLNFFNLPSPFTMTLGDNDGYIALQTSTESSPVYKFFTDLQPSQTTEVSVDDFTPLTKIAFPFTDGRIDAYTWTYGLGTPGEIETQRMVWLDLPALTAPPMRELTLYYPGDLFAEYHSGMFESFPGRRYRYVSILPTPPSTFKKVDGDIISVQQTGRTFTIITEGTYDFLNISGGISFGGNPNTNYRWSVTLPNIENLQYEMPEVPQEIIDEYDVPNSTEWNSNVSAGISDYSGLSGYTQYFEATFADAPTEVNYDAWTQHSNEYVHLDKDFDVATGRVAQSIKKLQPVFDKQMITGRPF